MNYTLFLDEILNSYFRWGGGSQSKTFSYLIRTDNTGGPTIRIGSFLNTCNQWRHTTRIHRQIIIKRQKNLQNIFI